MAEQARQTQVPGPYDLTKSPRSTTTGSSDRSTPSNPYALNERSGLAGLERKSTGS